MTDALRYEDERALVRKMAECYPGTFMLTTGQGRTFRVNAHSSYYNGRDVQLCVQVTDGEKWFDYCRATVDEIERYIIRESRP